MSTGTLIWIIMAVLVVCCGFTQCRVVRVLIKGEPVPKILKWHAWVPRGGRS